MGRIGPTRQLAGEALCLLLMVELQATLVQEGCREAHIKKRLSIAKTLSELNCKCSRALWRSLHLEKVNSSKPLGTKNCSFVCFPASVLPVESKHRLCGLGFGALIRKEDFTPVTRSRTASKSDRQTFLLGEQLLPFGFDTLFLQGHDTGIGHPTRKQLRFSLKGAYLLSLLTCPAFLDGSCYSNSL